MKEDKLALENENKNLKEDILCMEKELEILFAGEEDSCKNCENKECGCRVAEGKSILYVGGRTSVIPHCRAMVESKGGVFVHHDGGQEDNFSILNNIISRADAVFCPIDCVSHNACRKIKKICRERQKEIVLLRNSGISSFTRGIDQVFRAS